MFQKCGDYGTFQIRNDVQQAMVVPTYFYNYPIRSDMSLSLAFFRVICKSPCKKYFCKPDRYHGLVQT
jgi:dihydrodipicolinate synthase/N-acetylneuraminate lyase